MIKQFSIFLFLLCLPSSISLASNLLESSMAPQLLEGLTASSLISAKGAELRFWIIKTNELAEKKVLNISGNVDVLRGNLATHYNLDLTVNPRVDPITAPTVNEDIRDRQWADLAALGVEWREKIRIGIPFKLLMQNHGGICSEHINLIISLKLSF